MWAAHARLINGACISELGEPERGLELMNAAYELWTSTGTVITCSFYLALRAATCAVLGRVDEGLVLINEACRLIKVHGERYYEPEVLRIRGELLLLRARSGSSVDIGLADDAFGEAMHSARLLEFRSLELRIATSLARSYLAEGQTDRAVESLQSALDGLVQGFETRDQKVARELLSKLSDGAT